MSLVAEDKLSKQKKDVVLILDASISMHHLLEDTRGVIKSHIKVHRENKEANTRLAFVSFSGPRDYKVLYDGKASKASSKIANNYRVVSNTALHDAVAKTLLDFKPRKGAQVYVVIVTDGEENASVWASKDWVDTLMSLRRESGWDFVFIGVGSDGWSEASQYKNAQRFTVQDNAKGIGVMINASTSYVTRGTSLGLMEGYTNVGEDVAKHGDNAIGAWAVYGEGGSSPIVTDISASLSGDVSATEDESDE